MHLAQITNVNSPSTIFTTANYSNLLPNIVSRVLAFAIPIAGLYFFIRLLTSGFAYMTSMGDPGKLQTAQKQLTNALIGLILVFTAYFIAQLLLNIFGIGII